MAVVAMCAPRPLGVKRWRWDLRGLVSVALVALALVAAGCWSQPASAGTSRTLPGLSDVAGIVFGTHLLLILALVVYSVVVAVAMWWRRRRPDSDMDADTLRCGPLAALVLSTVTLNSLLAGLSVRTADALGRGVAIGSPTPGDPAPAIWYPRVYDLFAVGFVAGLLLVLVLVAIAWLTTGRDEPTDRIAAEYDDDQAAEDAILSALPPAPGGGRNDLERSQRRWLDGIRRRRRLAELVTRLDWALLAVSAVTVTLALIGVVADQLGHPLSVPNGVWWGRLSAACTWVVTLIPWAAVAVVLSGYRDRGRRRQLGVLWDVGMFWPRAFHPLAPPSYAERAVPDLEERIERLTKDRNGRQGRVLLMAHSQGTVLAAVALAQLASSEGTARRRVALVTYGAPLARLYRRAFPAYFGDGMLAELHGDLGAGGARWRNYHRKTDLIGGPVFTGTDELDRGDGDRRLRDPFTHWYAPRDPMPPALGHSSYMRDPSMRHEVDGLAGELLVEAAVSVVPPVEGPAEAVLEPGGSA